MSFEGLGAHIQQTKTTKYLFYQLQTCVCVGVHFGVGRGLAGVARPANSKDLTHIMVSEDIYSIPKAYKRISRYGSARLKCLYILYHFTRIYELENLMPNISSYSSS